MNPPTYTRSDLAHSPMIVFYETTRACDLMCLHCRADAQKLCHPHELTTAQATQLFDQLATFPKPPLLVLTGGDPLKRPDIFTLVTSAVASGLQVAMTPSATPLVTRDAILRLKQSGLHRLAVSLDGPDAKTHDGFRRVRGSFARTIEIIRHARAADLPVQINTTVSKYNRHQLDDIADLLTPLDITLWSVFFLIPTGRATADQRLTADECESVFETLYRQSLRQPYAIKTTEAPHYRRFLLQKQKAIRAAATVGATLVSPSSPPASPSPNDRRGDPRGRALSPSPCTQGEGCGEGSAYALQSGETTLNQPLPGSSRAGVKDGCGVLFISHTGQISPSGFLPLPSAQFPADNVVTAYQSHPTFLSLRDPSQLQGKCGLCEFNQICGGSRARAHAILGDPLASDPDCSYIPPRWKAQHPSSPDPS